MEFMQLLDHDYCVHLCFVEIVKNLNCNYFGYVHLCFIEVVRTLIIMYFVFVSNSFKRSDNICTYATYFFLFANYLKFAMLIA